MPALFLESSTRPLTSRMICPLPQFFNSRDYPHLLYLCVANLCRASDGIVFTAISCSHIHDKARTAPCERRHLGLSSLQTGLRLQSVRRPQGCFLSHSPRGSRSSASVRPIPSARTLGSRSAAERVDRELDGPCGDGETSRSLRKTFAVLLLLRREDDLVLHSLL